MSDTETTSIFDIEPDEVLEALLDAEAEADVAAGRVVSHAKVVAWLKSWGTPDELPCPTSETPWVRLSGPMRPSPIFAPFAGI